jgi:DNA-binding transcriptional LysR family regulator
VIEAGSFTRAAAVLGLPRSTVSAAVQALEGSVGALLLHRTTRRVVATLDGEAFYERCVRLLSDVEETEGLFRQESGGLTGRLRVDVPGRVGRLIIAPELPKFIERYPDMEIELGVSDRMVNLVEEGVDCAVRVGVLRDSALIARRIGELRLLNCASPAYLTKHGRPASIEDLDRHFAIGYALPSNGRIEPWEWTEDGELRFRDVRSRVVVNNAEAYIACCLAGLGLIQIPAYDVRECIARNELVEVLPEFTAATMPLSIVYPHRRHLSSRLRVFVDWLTPLLQSRMTDA